MRQDLVLRARNRFAPGLIAEVNVGRSQVEETVAATETQSEERIERESVQAAVRAQYRSSWATLGGTFRYRTRDQLPRTEARLDAALALGPVRIGAELGRSAWDDGGEAATYSSVHAEVGRLLGGAAFVELTRGERAAPVYGNTVTRTEADDRTGWRAGLTLDLGRATGSIAWISLDQAFAHPFGLPFDSAGRASAAGSAQGLEAHGRLVLFPRFLALESWITNWTEASGWTYLPLRSWRTALELHTVPLPSGNLEILGRAEAALRGAIVAYDPAGAGTRTVPAHTTADGYLQIRVIDVRMFIRWEDILGRDIEELPDRVYRGPRIFYGVKWNLWN